MRDITQCLHLMQAFNQMPGAASAKSRVTTSICYDFVKGQCSRGVQCRYSHDLGMIAKVHISGPVAASRSQDCHSA